MGEVNNQRNRSKHKVTNTTWGELITKTGIKTQGYQHNMEQVNNQRNRSKHKVTNTTWSRLITKETDQNTRLPTQHGEGE